MAEVTHDRSVAKQGYFLVVNNWYKFKLKVLENYFAQNFKLIAKLKHLQRCLSFVISRSALQFKTLRFDDLCDIPDSHKKLLVIIIFCCSCKFELKDYIFYSNSASKNCMIFSNVTANSIKKTNNPSFYSCNGLQRGNKGFLSISHKYPHFSLVSTDCQHYGTEQNNLF